MIGDDFGHINPRWKSKTPNKYIMIFCIVYVFVAIPNYFYNIIDDYYFNIIRLVDFYASLYIIYVGLYNVFGCESLKQIYTRYFGYEVCLNIPIDNIDNIENLNDIFYSLDRDYGPNIWVKCSYDGTQGNFIFKVKFISKYDAIACKMTFAGE